MSQSVHAHVDGDKREITLTIRRELDIHPHVVALPFDYVKGMAVEILKIEIALEQQLKQQQQQANIVPASAVQ